MRKRNPQINAAFSHEIHELVSKRAKALGLTKSALVALIVEQWKRSGGPAVSEADEALQERAAAKRKPSKSP